MIPVRIHLPAGTAVDLAQPWDLVPGLRYAAQGRQVGNRYEWRLAGKGGRVCGWFLTQPGSAPGAFQIEEVINEVNELWTVHGLAMRSLTLTIAQLPAVAGYAWLLQPSDTADFGMIYESFTKSSALVVAAKLDGVLVFTKDFRSRAELHPRVREWLDQ